MKTLWVTLGLVVIGCSAASAAPASCSSYATVQDLMGASNTGMGPVDSSKGCTVSVGNVTLTFDYFQFSGSTATNATAVQASDIKVGVMNNTAGFTLGTANGISGYQGFDSNWNAMTASSSFDFGYSITGISKPGVSISGVHLALAGQTGMDGQYYIQEGVKQGANYLTTLAGSNLTPTDARVLSNLANLSITNHFQLNSGSNWGAYATLQNFQNFFDINVGGGGNGGTDNPEPATYALFGSALAGLIAWKRKKIKA